MYVITARRVQDELKEMIEEAQFEDCQYHNLSGGIVALHIAYKY
jgi:demethylmenaquinone methyltransferase/2-methoxy-6-polyprenyl-1,4-benzoquinol methylase